MAKSRSGKFISVIILMVFGGFIAVFTQSFYLSISIPLTNKLSSVTGVVVVPKEEYGQLKTAKEELSIIEQKLIDADRLAEERTESVLYTINQEEPEFLRKKPTTSSAYTKARNIAYNKLPPETQVSIETKTLKEFVWKQSYDYPFLSDDQSGKERLNFCLWVALYNYYLPSYFEKEKLIILHRKDAEILWPTEELARKLCKTPPDYSVSSRGKILFK